VTVSVISRWPSAINTKSFSVTFVKVTSHTFSSTPHSLTVHSGGSGSSELYRRSTLIRTVSSSVPVFVTRTAYSFVCPAVRETFSSVRSSFTL